MSDTVGRGSGFYDMDELPRTFKSGFSESALFAVLRSQDDKFNLALTEADKRNEQRFVGQQVGVKTAMDASEKAVAAAMAASEKAVNKAELAADKRFSDLKDAIDAISKAQSKLAGGLILAAAALPLFIWFMDRH
jgi:hypothetical protein